MKVTDLGLPTAASGSSDFKALEERGLICLEAAKKNMKLYYLDSSTCMGRRWIQFGVGRNSDTALLGFFSQILPF